ncbi:sacsin N-terminal ATP-binding-like domain-containing protein [uncultured Cellulomonas sp.]|uniref:sacsin N-terminal ATP-binding-like domain-containing protein n=1 Tax=uncultured Cellulomonas sp. TaxID=189682 RepID=UPI00260D74D2|nr:ATP-binding protein [uncultured Cellulomonas sp.]
MTFDAFGTAALRAAVLGAWAASPARLREDANAEEDHARGHYRDRVVVELAQNAADAAARAGVPGRLLLRLTRSAGVARLLAANTGAPLDPAGVASLASLRASAKRGSPGAAVVGRFGVGFAAVRAVADEIAVRSTSGSVRFSLARTGETLGRLAADHPELADEVRRRDGSLPALRLPEPDDGRPPGGYDTAVEAVLRDDAAAAEVAAQLAAVADPLLLALPALAEVVVEVDESWGGGRRRLADVERRWHVVRRGGTLDLALVADRPVEERAAREWRVTWALPRASGPGAEAGAWGGVVHAPTPTDDTTALPALLIATLPLDPSRRRVRRGPLTDVLLDAAADAYADLAAEVRAGGGDPLGLVPTGLPAGPLDAQLHERVVTALSRTRLLPSTGAADDDEPVLVEPRRAVALDGPVGRDPDAVAALSGWAAHLVVLGPGQSAPARTLGVELRDLADVVEEMAPAGEPARWHALYAALAPHADDATVREALGAVPVPLADGRTVRGARGLVLGVERLPGGAGEALAVLARWGVRLVHPAAAHPLLERLGAVAPDGPGLLGLPAVREAVLDAAEDDDDALAEDVAAAVLTLVAAALADGDVPPGASAWLGQTILRSADGEPTPADGLVLPGSLAARLLDERVLAPVHPALVERWGPDVVVAAGVRDGLALTTVPDVLADPDGGLLGDGPDPAALAAQSLDGWEEYLEDLADRLGGGAFVGDLVAVADLDAVREDAWPRVAGHVAADPGLRRALLGPVRVEGDAATGGGPAGTGATAPSYTAWWLRERAPQDLGLGEPFALPGAEPAVTALLRPAPGWLPDVRTPDGRGLDEPVLSALGGVRSLGDLDPTGWTDLLEMLGPVGTRVEPGVAAALWRALARAATDGLVLDLLPDRLPALVGPAEVRVVRADDAVVPTAPMWLQRTDLGALVPVPAAAAVAVADLLDLPRCEDLAAGTVGDGGRPRDGDRDVHAHVDGDGPAPTVPTPTVPTPTVPAPTVPTPTVPPATVPTVTVPTPPAALALVPGAPAHWREHEDLHVDGVPVDWWVEGHGPGAVVHASHLAALARGLAQAAGAWQVRHAVEFALADPGRAPELVTEAMVDPS